MATDGTKKCNVLPNILITGTPGVGKSYVCDRLSKKLQLRWLDCSKLAKEHNFFEDHDDEYNCYVLDEDKLLDYLEPLIKQGGNIIEYHGCEFFPEAWFQAVFVITCSNTVLYDRLRDRNYNEKKIKSNIECEIFAVILEEATNSYNNDIVYTLKGDNEKDADNSVETIENWYKSWQKE